ncbi:MAG TPA: hypothetical protein PKI34_06060, partial [Bacteroidales bacterium]|nr:hypothetical protein [Bacteroidales bacterium]
MSTTQHTKHSIGNRADGRNRSTKIGWEYFVISVWVVLIFIVLPPRTLGYSSILKHNWITNDRLRKEIKINYFDYYLGNNKGDDCSVDAGEGGIIGECSDQIFQINASVTGTEPYTYEWTGDGVNYLNFTTIEDPIFGPAPDGSYTLTLTVTDDYGCTASDNVTIIVAPAPTVEAGTGGTIGECASETFQIAASSSGTGLEFAWTGTGTAYLSSTTIEDPIFGPAPDGSYTL